MWYSHRSDTENDSDSDRDHDPTETKTERIKIIDPSDIDIASTDHIDNLRPTVDPSMENNNPEKTVENNNPPVFSEHDFPSGGVLQSPSMSTSVVQDDVNYKLSTQEVADPTESPPGEQKVKRSTSVINKQCPCCVFAVAPPSECAVNLVSLVVCRK